MSDDADDDEFQDEVIDEDSQDDDSESQEYDQDEKDEDWQPQGKDGEKIENITSDAIFLGQVSSFDDLIEQINTQLRCKATFNCQGKNQRAGITRVGLGGAIEIVYRCSKCTKRTLTFKSSENHNSLTDTIIGVALQVAFIAAGLTYRKYQLVMAAGLGLNVVSNKVFNKTLRHMKPVVKKQLDSICSHAKESMQKMDPLEMGSWKNAITTGDAAWLTRGHFSQNATVIIQNYECFIVLQVHVTKRF